MSKDQIFASLPKYDCGLVFIETGDWIKMSSPTKIGEYLAAGLHVLGLEGIEVLNRLSQETKSVDILPRNFNYLPNDISWVKKILENIRNPNRIEESFKIAKKYYDINIALKSYLDLYKKIENV